jgi:hypothetical protein
MSSEAKPVVLLAILSLVPLDLQNTYKTCLEIAKNNDAIFQGIWPGSLVNPNRDFEQIGFIVDADSINNIIENVKAGLKLTNERILYTITPSIRPKVMPPSSMAT